MKYSSFFILIILFNTNIGFATAQKANVSGCDSIYNSLDSLVALPSYKGGVELFMKLNEEVANPAPYIAGRTLAKARVIIKCGIDKEGHAFNPSVIRISRTYYDYEHDKFLQEYDENWAERIEFDYCEKEAFRILNLMEFIPAKLNDTNVCFGGFVTIIFVYYSAIGYD